MNDRRHDEIPDGEFESTGGPPVALILAAVLGILAVVFIVQNSDTATTQFLWVGIETKLWVTILISIALGVLIDRLFSIWWRRRHREED